jgi:hypothetical protein
MIEFRRAVMSLFISEGALIVETKMRRKIFILIVTLVAISHTVFAA